MKFPLLVLLAAGALSAPRFEFNDFQEYVGLESKCDNLRRLNDHATTMFEYVGETENTVQGSTSDSTGMRMRAKIYIHPQGACRFSMQINNAELLVKSKNSQTFVPAKESSKFARELEARTISFEASSGKIERLFPEVGEPVHVLNMKRGILSTLQLGTATTEEEVDVNGRCRVSVVEQNGNFVKTKNLTECTERTHNELGIQTATLESDKMPIKPLNSTSRCLVATKNQEIVEVECTESHVFRPFSAGYQNTAGAVTTVKQYLRYMGAKSGRVVSKFAVESKDEGVSMIYEHETGSVKPDNSIINRIDNVMTKLVTRTRMGAKQESAHEFTQLVTLLRKVDQKRMRPVMEKYFDCDRSGMCKSSETDLKGVYRQYFLDALTYCGTATCVSSVRDIILKDEVTGENMNMFLQGIALVGKPTKGMIRDVKEIAQSKPSRQAFLTLGTLMHRYCSANEEQCAYGKTNPVTHAEHFLEDKLARSCNIDDLDKVEEVLMAIKAIGNAGRPSRATGTLLSCAKTASHQNITTAALEALRRMPCSENTNEKLHEMLENTDLDTEKRIQSYVALMRCPTSNTIQTVVGHLEKEKCRQLGSFMWSHLKNVNESSDPRHKSTQEMLAAALKGRELKEFNLPFTSFSKAFEGSLYSKYMKSGASVDGHVIFHQDSFIPKRALLNVTANILDVPVHVFQMAARVDGVETLIEDLFGSANGYFPDNSIIKIFDYTFTKEDRNKLRSKRHAGGMQDTLEALHDKVNKKRTQPSGSLSMQILGHEMRFFSYDDLFWAADKIDNMNVIDLLLKVAKGGHKTFTKSVMFLEMTHTVPTGLGLPIKLALKGSAVGSLELDGKFDIRNMFWGPSSLELKGYVKPSAVVEVTGQMGVHSRFVDTGVFVNSSVFTSQMMKGSVVYKEGKTFKLNIDAPEEPIEIFNVSSTPFMFVNEEIAMIEGTPRRLSPDFCLNSTMVLGLGVCTSLSVPVAFRDYEAPYYPLSGPSHFGMKIIKADPKLTTYQFLVSMEKKAIRNGRELVGSFEFGTPGATYSRGFSGMMRYQETDKIRRLLIGEFRESKSAEMMIEYQNNTNRFEVDFRNNLFTKKTMRGRFVFFNETSESSKRIGVLASAAYDWYTFQHITDFTREADLLSLKTKTEYWPKKFVAAQVSYTPSDKDLMVKFEANHMNQTVQMNGRYVKTTEERGLNFTVKHLQTGKKSSMYMGLMNSEDTKKAMVNVTTPCGAYSEASLGYYTGELVNSVRLSANIAGRTAALFVSYSNINKGWLNLDVGAMVQENVVGIISSYNAESASDKHACATVYYNDKRPAKTCVAWKEAGKAARLMWTLRVLNRTGAVSFDYSKVEGRRAVTTTVVYNEREMYENTMSFAYKSLWEMELKTITKIGEKSVSGRLFSEVQSNSDVAFGIEANGLKKMAKLQATYSKVRSEDSTLYSVKVEAWANKKLPVNYVASLTYGMGQIVAKSVLNVNEYQMISSMSWKKNDAKRTATRFFGILKRDFVIFSSDVTDTLSLTETEKFFKTEWQFVILNKSFKYGWDVTYRNRSTESKSAHAVTLGVDYARGRRAFMTTTFANSKKSAKILVDVMYLPSRQVSHSISYDKESRQLDISVEFLPRMFVKLTGKLDKVNGWRLTTDLQFTWVNYNRVLTWISSYVNRSDIQGLSFRFLAYNKEFFVGSEYNNKTKTAIFTMSAMGRTVRIAGYWLKNQQIIGLRLFTENKQGNELIPTEILEATVNYGKTKLVFELRTRTRSYLKTVAFFNRKSGVASFEAVALRKSLFKIQGELKRSQALAISRLFVLGKERFQVIGKLNKGQKTVFLTFDALKKNWNVMFAAKVSSERKEVTFSTEFLGRIAGFNGRFDPKNYIASWSVFYEKHQAGWTAYYDAKNNAVVYNVTLTPTLSAQAVLQIIDNRVISVALQRKFGLKIVNEAVFRYELNSLTSNLVFKWNKDTTAAIRDTIVPLVKKSLKEATTFAKNFGTTSRKVSIELAQNITSQLLRAINKADKTFDDIDFAGIKDKTGELVVKILKESAALTNKGLKMTSKALNKVHKNLPEIMEKMRVYARKSADLSKVVANEATKIAKIGYMVAKNLTESGIPVAKTALKLAKEFKIRGKTMEEVVVQVAKMAEKITKTWKKNLSQQLMKLKKDTVEYIVNMPVPYRKERLGQLFEMYMKKAREFRANFNLEEKTRQLVRDIKEYQIKGMTVMKHYEEMLKNMKNLPEEMKVKIVKYIKDTRVYAKQIKKTLKTVSSFAEPIVRCLMKVQKSVDKHFSPLFVDAAKEMKTLVTSEFTNVYAPTKQRISRLIDIIERFMAPFLKPIKPLYVKLRNQIRSLRVVEYEIGALLDSFLESYKMELETQLKRMTAAASAEIKRVVKSAKSLYSMTPEQIAVSSIDRSIVFGKEALEYVKTVYKNREAIFQSCRSKCEKVIADAKTVYAVVTSKPVEDMIHIGFKMTGEKLIASIKEFVKVIDQLSMMEIAQPLEQAWKELDLFNHLERYGVNSRIVRAIAAAKKFNLTEALMGSIDMAREEIMKAVGMAEAKYMKMYKSVESVYKYVRAIPKREWEDFYAEVEAYLMKNKGDIYEIVKKVVSFAKMRLMKSAEVMKTVYGDYVESYGKPAMRLAKDLKKRALLVYSENKDDCSIVMNMYKDIITGILKERYNIVKTYGQKVYQKYYNALSAFYNKHEGKTWEEIGENVYAIGKKNYDVAYTKAEKKMQELRVMAKKGVALAKELYKNATILSEKYLALMKEKYHSKIRPEALRMKVELMKKVESAKMYYNKLVTMYKKMYAQAYSEALKMYEANKKLSLRQLYKKGADTVNSNVMKLTKKMKAIAKKNYEEFNAKAEKLYAKAVEMKQRFNKEVLPVVLVEAESVLNQTLRATVILANETVKAYTPHCRIVKAYAGDYYRTGSNLAAKYYKEAGKYATKYMAITKERSLVMYKNGLTKAAEHVEKVIAYLKEVARKIQEHPKYQQIIKHEKTVKMIEFFKKMVEALKAKIAVLKVRINELKAHPKVLEYKQKFEELKEKVMALRQHANVLKMLRVLRQVKESGLFTVEKLRAKLAPIAEKIRLNAAKAPVYVSTHAVMFRRDPAECFWTNVANMKSAIKMVNEYSRTCTVTKKNLKDLILEVTDEPTKQAYATLRKSAVEVYAKYHAIAKAAPGVIREKSLEMYKKQMTLIKGKITYLKTQWTRCPMYPIVNHEIWGDIVDEIKNHEIVTEVASVAAKTKEILKMYKNEMVRKVKSYSAEKKAEIKAKIDMMITKCNAFLDETTLEDIVNKVQHVYSVQKTNIIALKEKMTIKMRKVYAAAMEKYTMHKARLMVVGDKYYKKALTMWEEKYPKMVNKATVMYKKSMERLEKLMKQAEKYSKEMKTRAVEKVLKLWTESCIKKGLVTLKGMTIGETVTEIKMLPMRARKLYARVEKMVRRELEVLKSKFDKHVLPRVQKIEKVVRSVVHEINATGIFVYRYYNLEGNMKRLINSSAAQIEIGVNKVKGYLPQIPGKARMYAKDLAKKSLKAVHTSLVYLDNVDLRPYIERISKIKDYVPDMNRYVVLDTVEGQLVFTIHHMSPVEPNFRYQVKKIEKAVRAKANKITRKTIKMTKKMIAYIRKETAELRQDLNMSFVSHSQLGMHLKNRIVAASAKAWNKSSDLKDALYQTAKVVKENTGAALNKGKTVSKAVFNFANDAIVDITYSNGLEQAFAKAKFYSKTAIGSIQAEFSPMYNATMKYAKRLGTKMSLEYMKLAYKAQPYYILLKTAAKDWRQGAEFRTAFRVIEVQMKKTFNSLYQGLVKKSAELKKTAMDLLEAEDYKVMEEYLEAHKEILGKYAQRLNRIYRYNKLRMHISMRRTKKMMLTMWRSAPKMPKTSVAMIFGKQHVMTFDKTFYDVPKFAKKHCTYLLARDFQSGNFTVMSQEENLIVQTPDIEVMIKKSGEVVSTLKAMKSGYQYKKIVSGLPIESKTSTCVRRFNSIVCEFKQGLKVDCNVKNFLCSIEMSPMLYGKTQGLLGTNNNEVFDEMKLPNNKITSSVTEFMNSWLVTQSSECMIKEESNEAPTCNKAPSDKCFEVLKSSESPLSPMFQNVDPLPFLKACLVDTADCESQESATTSHCAATKAYMVALSQQGYRPRNVQDCVTFTREDGKIMKFEDEWVQPMKKDVDVVVLVSERKSVRKMRRTIATMLYYVNKDLEYKGFNTKYAVIGFGGKGVNEKPHFLMRRGQFFRNAAEMTSMVKEIPYTGDSSNTNDAYDAIHMASKMQFRPGARKVFMLFNFDEQKSGFFGPSLDETVKVVERKADATLLVFDDFKFKTYGKSGVIGQTSDRVYLSPDFQAVPMADYEMPRSAFTELARSSNGGLFLNKFRPAELKVMVTAVSDALVEPLTSSTQSQLCRVGRTANCKTIRRMNN